MTPIDPHPTWFYNVGDQVHGPVSHIDLREKAAAGEIGPDTWIRSGHRKWRRAEQVHFLSEFFSPVERSNAEADAPSDETAHHREEPKMLNSDKTDHGKQGPIQCLEKGLERLNAQLQRFTPALLMVTIGLLVVSVILQGIMCLAVVAVQKRMSNFRTGVPVEVTNYEVPVDVRNSEVDVNVRNHRISSSDPIPVEVTNASYDPIPVEVTNSEVDVNVVNR